MDYNGLTPEERDAFIRRLIEHKAAGRTEIARRRAALRILVETHGAEYAGLIGQMGGVTGLEDSPPPRILPTEYLALVESELLPLGTTQVVDKIPNWVGKSSELVGYRNWALRGNLLRSPHRGIIWDSPILVSSVLPSDENVHGIYAWELRRADLGPNIPIGGLVELLGKVVEHEDGRLRAEIARLLCLVTSYLEDDSRISYALSAFYRVPVVVCANTSQRIDEVHRWSRDRI